jgi:hypothetical protein
VSPLAQNRISTAAAISSALRSWNKLLAMPPPVNGGRGGRSAGDGNEGTEVWVTMRVGEDATKVGQAIEVMVIQDARHLQVSERCQGDQYV